MGRKLLVSLVICFYFLCANVIFYVIPPVIHAQPTTRATSRLTLTVAGNTNVVIEKINGTESQIALILDSLSSTKVILSSDGSIVASPQYYPYGNSLSQLSQNSNNRYYTGQRKVDQDDNIYNYNARYYSPDTGIFTQPDSVEGPNRFAYVAGNPVMKNDPSGHCASASLRSCLDPGEILLGSAAWKQANYQSPEDHERAMQGILSFAMTGGNLLRMTPPGGAAVGALELITGRQWGSGEKLTDVDKGFAAISFLPFIRKPLKGSIKVPALNSSSVASIDTGINAAEAEADVLLTNLLKSSSAETQGEAFRTALGSLGGNVMDATDYAPEMQRGANRVFLGHYRGTGRIYDGVETPIPLAGKQYLQGLASNYGGRTLVHMAHNDISGMKEAISASDDIVFNIGKHGVHPNSLTHRELLHVVSNPELMKRTTFLFGATY